jgi:hypothetical protein
MCQNSFAHSLAAASFSTAIRSTPEGISMVHRLDIACSVAKLRDFMSDAQQWLPWTMPRLQSVQPLPFGQWLLKTSRTMLKLRLCPATAHDELRYEIVVPGLGNCQTLVRMSDTQAGCHLTVTHHKHALVSLLAFTRHARHTLGGLQTLKLVLEQD